MEDWSSLWSCKLGGWKAIFKCWAGAAEIGVKFESCVIKFLLPVFFDLTKKKKEVHTCSESMLSQIPHENRLLWSNHCWKLLSCHPRVLIHPFKTVPHPHISGVFPNPIYKNDNSRKLFPDSNSWDRREVSSAILSSVTHTHTHSLPVGSVWAVQQCECVPCMKLAVCNSSS